MMRASRSAAMAKHAAAATLLALLSVSVAVSAASAVSLLPLSGWQTVDVELVCRTAASNRPTVFSTSTISAFSFSVDVSVPWEKGRLKFPLIMDRTMDSDFVRTYYINDTDKYTVTDSGGCVHTKGSFSHADEVLVAQTLIDVLSEALPVSFSVSVNRGMEVENFVNLFNLTIPSAFGGLGTMETYSALIGISVPGWMVNLVQVNKTALTVEMTAHVSAKINDCLFTVTFLGRNVSDLLMPFTLPASCKGTTSALSSIAQLAAKPMGAARSSLPTIAGLASAPALSLSATSDSSSLDGYSLVPATASSSSIEAFSLVPASASSSSIDAFSLVPASEHTSSSVDSSQEASSHLSSQSSSSEWFDDNNPPMPDFPDEFTAEFFVIAPMTKSVFEVYEAFSATQGTSYTRLLLPVSSVADRSVMYEWFIDSYNQLAYFNTKNGVQRGNEDNDKALRDYFFPDQDTCRRVLIGYEMMAKSASALLLYSPTVPPTFIGNQTVRNVPCGVWAAEVSGVLVTWFWATSGSVDTTPFHTPESVQSGLSDYSRLLRMTVVGHGGPLPLFPHHPFFPQGYAFPVADRALACRALGPGEGDIGCNANEGDEDFIIIYDITTFVSYVRRDDYNIPKACDGAKISGSIPSVLCRYGGITGGAAAILLVVIALLFALVSGCCVWCPFSRMVRHQQDELARLTWEIHLAEGANGTDGQDTAIVSAAGGADAKNSSS
ncbi:hypothetical protein LSCM1_01137 [Leishmania martiniquensis]|uniref:Uncharacterized protein n=1 Tax=Leishmania martiniquensis TaxID=1580590 RepID=A0A836G7M8_9TRYP|nr:hypothetical protein LSCM1_01137 [Leishmania martiniquensis]